MAEWQPTPYSLGSWGMVIVSLPLYVKFMPLEALLGMYEKRHLPNKPKNLLSSVLSSEPSKSMARFYDQHSAVWAVSTLRTVCC